MADNNGKARRRRRAERRKATRHLQIQVNIKMLRAKHPGWTGPAHNDAGDLVKFLRNHGFTVHGDNDNGYATVRTTEKTRTLVA